MAITLVTDPKKTVNGILSDVASTGQLFYEFKREDFQITEVVTNSGDAQLLIDSGEGDVSAEFAVGDNVYFEEGGNDYTPGIFSVKSVTFSTNTKVTLNLAFDVDTTGYINLMARIKWNIEVSILDSFGLILLISFVLKFASKQSGVIRFDIGRFLKGHLVANELQDVIYKLRYREAYIGLTPPALTSLNNVQAVDSMQPLLHEGGSNMWDFLLDTNSVKLLTRFENPVLWAGWKREVGYIIDSDYTGRLTNAPHSLFRYLDQNRIFISNSDDTLRSATAALYSLPLEVAAIPATANFIDATITDDVSGAARTQTLQFQILEECKNPIMIEWLNTLGHFEQHLFEMDQEFNDSIEEGFEWQRAPIDDISAENNLIGRVEGDLSQVITMADQDLNRNQIQALREIKSSPVVRLFLNKAGTTFINVTVNSLFDTLFNSDSTAHEMQLSIKLPKNVNFYASKLY